MAEHSVQIEPIVAPSPEPVPPDPAGVPWLWMDMTTSFRARSGQMNGTLRVEQSYAKALNEFMGRQLRFCRYHRTRRCFVPLDSHPSLSGKTSRAAKGGARQASSALRTAGRQLERTLRNYYRAVAGGIMRSVSRRDGASAFSQATAGEVLLLAGENWAQFDFEVIAGLRRECGVRIAALCQDLIPIACPQFFASEDFVARYRAYADFLVRDVDLVIAISESTKSDILRHARGCGGVSGRVEVVQLGADLVSVQSPRPPSELPDLRPRRFVLSVSTIQSRKNFDLLYHLWRRLSEENVPGLPILAIVGQPGFGSRDLLWQIEQDPLTRGRIALLHRAGDEELAWLYQNCLWTLYPSFYEGWGLPISESLAYGKYCLASNASSLPEAGAGLVKHLDPLDFAAWRSAILELIASPERLASLEKSIRIAYRPMTWARSAEILAAHLSKLRGAQLAAPAR